MAAMVEARSMAAAGNVGADLDDVMRHASELLDVLDGVLLRLDAKEHDAVFQARWVLRLRLERLRDDYGAVPRTKKEQMPCPRFIGSDRTSRLT